MLEALGPGTRLGYCTNVHAGADLDATLANLAHHAAAVREELGVEELGIGLWLSSAAATAALARIDEARDRIGAMGLRVFTLNGFPYTDFHGPVVKHRVYEPSWSDVQRRDYTLTLIDVLDKLLPPGEEGSISTLPVGWPSSPCAPVSIERAARFLEDVTRRLAALEARTGRLIHVDLEPEPGCILQRSGDVVRFFEDSLFNRGGEREDDLRRYMRVCHDVCHSAVMFEGQREAMETYRRAGISVGKVQVSSAIAARGPAMAGLRSFIEPRYLHQTCVKGEDGKIRAYEDLPVAVEHERCAGADDEWRVHFHVPVYLDRIDEVRTTRDEIPEAIGLAKDLGVRHYELETYAWTVLPAGLRRPVLSNGIADELRWVANSGGAA